MEHRCSTKRHQCNIKILIYKNKTPVAFGRIKNGSASGLFIETDLKNIQLGQLLTLDMMLNNVDLKNFGHINISVLIVHKTKNGFGSEIEIPISEHAELFSERLKGELATKADLDICSSRKLSNCST